jgi:hypothetical protein
LDWKRKIATLATLKVAFLDTKFSLLIILILKSAQDYAILVLTKSGTKEPPERHKPLNQRKGETSDKTYPLSSLFQPNCMEKLDCKVNIILVLLTYAVAVIYWLALKIICF